MALTRMHLVVRGPDVETTVLKALAKLSGASAIEQVTPNVFRLRNASPAPGIEELCAQQRLEWTFEDPAN
jgi:phosphoserine phosphatase